MATLLWLLDVVALVEEMWRLVKKMIKPVGIHFNKDPLYSTRNTPGYSLSVDLSTIYSFLSNLEVRTRWDISVSIREDCSLPKELASKRVVVPRYGSLQRFTYPACIEALDEFSGSLMIEQTFCNASYINSFVTS